jgi:transposase InsO family protein
MVHYIPTASRATAVDVANLFINFIWKLHGLPKKTISNRGPLFNAKFLRQVYKRLGIEPHFSTVYQPQVNGQLERANQFVEIFLQHYINHCQMDWVAFLPIAEFAYNNGYTLAQTKLPSIPAMASIPSSQLEINLPIKSLQWTNMQNL